MSRNREYLEKQARRVAHVCNNVAFIDPVFRELETFDNALEKLQAAMLAVNELSREVEVVENDYAQCFPEGSLYMEYRHKSGK